MGVNGVSSSHDRSDVRAFVLGALSHFKAPHVHTAPPSLLYNFFIPVLTFQAFTLVLENPLYSICCMPDFRISVALEGHSDDVRVPDKSFPRMRCHEVIFA